MIRNLRPKNPLPKVHTCDLCGKELSTLKRHLRETHDVSLASYLKDAKRREDYDKGEKSLKLIRKQNSPVSHEFYIKRGCGVEEAFKLAEEKKSLQKEAHKRTFIPPSQTEHWLQKGFPLEEAEQKRLEYIASISGKRDIFHFLSKEPDKEIAIETYQNYRSSMDNRKATYIKNCVKNGMTENQANDRWYAQRIAANKKASQVKRLTPWNISYWQNKLNLDKCRATMMVALWQSGLLHGRNLSRFTDDMPFTSQYEYRKAVSFYDHLTLVEFGNEIDPFNLRGKDYHIDHIYSRGMGFRNKISPAIIGSVYNLRLIGGHENRVKSSGCDLDIEKLIQLFIDNPKNQSRFYFDIIEEKLNEYSSNL